MVVFLHETPSWLFVQKLQRQIYILFAYNLYITESAPSSVHSESYRGKVNILKHISICSWLLRPCGFCLGHGTFILSFIIPVG